MKKKLVGSALVIAALAPSMAVPYQQQGPAKPGTQGPAREKESSDARRRLVEEKVKEIIADQLGVEKGEIKPDARFVEDLGADSLDCVEFVLRFEEEFSIEIPDEDAEKLLRVRDVYDYVVKRVQQDSKQVKVRLP